MFLFLLSKFVAWWAKWWQKVGFHHVMAGSSAGDLVLQKTKKYIGLESGHEPV
jgi:hypothetical protein